MSPTHMTPEQVVAERDGYRATLQRMIQDRESFTEKELGELQSVGVNFDPVTKQLQWTPVNGTDRLVAEWNAYHHAILSLMEFPEINLTAEEVEHLRVNGVTSEQLMAEIDEMVREYHSKEKSR